MLRDQLWGKLSKQIHVSEPSPPKLEDLGPGRICLITMADAHAASKYQHHLRSQFCYAQRHNIRYTREHLHEHTPFAKSPLFNGSVSGRAHPTFMKLNVISHWLENAECDWIGWFDADVYFANHSIPIQPWLEQLESESHAVQLVLTDHTCALNAGGIFLRNSDWIRNVFMRRWHGLMQLAVEDPTVVWPMQDNGGLAEAIVQQWIPSYKPLSCLRSEIVGIAGTTRRCVPKLGAKESFWNCVHRNLDDAFGQIRADVPFRCARCHIYP